MKFVLSSVLAAFAMATSANAATLMLTEVQRPLIPGSIQISDIDNGLPGNELSNPLPGGTLDSDDTIKLFGEMSCCPDLFTVNATSAFSLIIDEYVPGASGQTLNFKVRDSSSNLLADFTTGASTVSQVIFSVAMADTYLVEITQAGGASSRYDLTINGAAVPLPGALPLMGAALGLGAFARRRRAKAA